MNLHIGCGDRRLPGFVNIDLSGTPDRRLDVREGLPYPPDSVEYIYSEHFIEHLPREQGLAFLAECRRVLAPGGVVRVATPDLDEAVRGYVSGGWREQEWLTKYPYGWVPNRAVMLNQSLREWGHQHLYNAEDLMMVGRLAGFVLCRPCAVNESPVRELAGLESRPESFVLEFIKESAAQRAELPLVSIVVPAYNEKYLEAALGSALGQTYPNLEIIVSNDNPGGRIAEIVKDLGRPEVRCVTNERNLGSRLNNLKCLELAGGTYVKYLNDDDLLAPDCVLRMVCCFEAYGPRVTLVTSKRRCIDAAGRPLPDNSSTRPLVAADSLIDGKDLGNFLLTSRENLIGEPSTVMFRKADLPQVPALPFTAAGKNVAYSGDMWMWLILLAKGDAVYLADPLSSFRLHEGQEQHQARIILIVLKAWAEIMKNARPLGFLAEPAQQALALDIYRRGLEGWETHPEFGQIFPAEGQEEVRALRRQVEQELGAVLDAHPELPAVLAERPSLGRQLEKIRRSEGWFPPLRHIHLRGKLIRMSAEPAAPPPRGIWSRLAPGRGAKKRK